jgi:hypothetical protein
MKIFLNKNSENTVCLPLTCNVSVSGTPIYFLFRLINTQSSEETIFTGLNLSNNTARYDKFNWIETGSTPNYTASTFEVKPVVFMIMKYIKCFHQQTYI